MASTVITRLIAKTEQHDSALATATASVNRYVDSITDVKGAVNAALGMMPQFLTAAGAVSALGGAIMQNIQTARDFEKSMSSLSSLTGMSGEALNQLKEKAIELGGSSTQSASQVVEAFQLIGSQKPELLKSQEALASVTKSAITLAEAAGMAVPEAAAALTGSLNQMGEGADKAEDYINILAAASQQGAGDINYLNTAITQSGATAKAVGLSYNQLVAALESIAEGGFDASTAGTALRNILLALESQTNNNFKPSVVGATEAIKNLRDANLSATDMMDMFGKQNMAVASTLISNAEKFDTLTESITGTNTATEQASINTDNLDGDLKALESAWEKLNLTINDGNGLIRPFVQFLTQVVDAMTDIYKATEPVREAIGSFCDSFEPIINTILPNIKGLLKDLREIANLMGSITDGDASAGAGIGAMGGRLITTPTVVPDPIVKGNNSDNTNKGKPKATEPEYIPLEGSIDAQAAKVAELTKAWKAAADEPSRKEIKAQLDEANAVLDRMNGKSIQPVKTQDLGPIQELQQHIKLVETSMAAATNANDWKAMNEELMRSKDQLADITALQNLMGVAMQNGINDLDIDSSGMWHSILNGDSISDDTWLALADTINTRLAELGIDPIKIDVETGSISKATPAIAGLTDAEKASAREAIGAGHAFTSMSAALNAIPDAGAKVAGLIGQAIGSTAAAYGTAQMQAASMGPWAWIAFAATGLATMITTITGIKQATAGAYANGGVIGGNSWQGDRLFARVNSGETILNTDQATYLNDQLDSIESTGMQTPTARSVVTGEQLYQTITNWGRRTGKGELLFG